MRTAPSRVRRLLGLLVVAVSVGWLLLRRRTGSALPLPAMAPSATPRPPAAPEVLATDAGLTVESAAPAPQSVTEPAPQVLATDAGLTPTGAMDDDAGLAPAGAVDDAAGLPPAGAVDDDAGLPPTVDATVLPEPVDAALPAPTGPDDLQAIRGIGPAIERTLHELGITTFRQVADLHGAELDAVRQRLETFSARIERQDWAGQARELHRQKYGDAP